MIDERIVRHEWNGNEETITDIGPLIRCKDCNHRNKSGFCKVHWHPVVETGYCASGKAKEGEK